MAFTDAFTSRELVQITAAGTRVRLPQGWSPIWEQTPADKAYLILEGTVSVRRGGVEFAQLTTGDIMGETAIVGHTLRTASLVALTNLELLHLTAEAVRRLAEEMPAFQRALEQVAVERARGAATA